MATIEELQQQVAALSAQVAAITTPPTDYYTSQYSGEEIDQGVGRALPGGGIDAALESKMEIEFLDNTDFTNPVAQAGIGGMHGSVPFAVDRWKLISGTVSWSSNGLTLNGTIRQIREFPVGFSVVPSIEMHSGTATITYDDTTKYCDITSSGGVIKRPHLGLVAITDWPKIPPTNFDEELAKCQGSYQRTNVETYSRLGYGAVTAGSKQFIFTVPLARTMRSNPAVAIGTTGQWIIEISNLQIVSIDTFAPPTGVETMLLVTTSSAAERSGFDRLRNIGAASYIDFIADI